MSNPDVANIVDSLIIGLLIFIGGYLLRRGRRITRFFKRLDAMAGDWHGHTGDPARGVAEVLPMPQRMALLEHELRRNGGVQTDPVTGRVQSGSQKDISTAVLEQLQQLTATLGAQIGDRQTGSGPQ